MIISIHHQLYSLLIFPFGTGIDEVVQLRLLVSLTSEEREKSHTRVFFASQRSRQAPCRDFKPGIALALPIR